MSAQAADAAIQQIVYSVQAAIQSRKPVRFSADTLLGVDTIEPVTEADPLDALSLVSVSDPAEGATVHGSFTATGVASSFEATVPWEIREGDQVVKKGFATAEGWMDKLYPWQADVDVSDLPPGDVLLPRHDRRPLRRRGRQRPLPRHPHHHRPVARSGTVAVGEWRAPDPTTAQPDPAAPPAPARAGRPARGHLVRHLVGLQAQENLPPYLSLARPPGRRSTRTT